MSNIAAVPAHDEHADRVFLDMLESIQGNLNDGVVTPRQATLTRATNQSIGSGTDTPISFDGSGLVTDGSAAFDLAGNPTRLTIVVAGWYKVWGGLVVGTADGPDALTIEAAIRKNGTTFVAKYSVEPNSLANTHVAVATVDYFNAGDYIELTARHDKVGGGNIVFLAVAEIGNVLRVVRA